MRSKQYDFAIRHFKIEKKEHTELEVSLTLLLIQIKSKFIYINHTRHYCNFDRY